MEPTEMKKRNYALAIAALVTACTTLPVRAQAGQLTLTWDYTQGTSLATGFRVERAPAPPATTFTSIGVAAGQDKRSYVDLTVVAGTTYQYRVQAYNDGGAQSTYSNIASGTARVSPPNGTFPTSPVATPPPPFIALNAGEKRLLYTGTLTIGPSAVVHLNPGELVMVPRMSELLVKTN